MHYGNALVSGTVSEHHVNSRTFDVGQSRIGQIPQRPSTARVNGYGDGTPRIRTGSAFAIRSSAI